MGLFYANLTLTTTDRDAVKRQLCEQDRMAYVSPPGTEFTVVFDRQMEDQDFGAIDSFVKQMTRSLGCIGLAAVLHDDDVLYLTLVDKGIVVDRYDSSPAYFDADSEPLPPAGGDAELFCRLFRQPDSHHHLRQLLRADLLEGDMPGIVGEQQRHAAIASSLGIPEYCAYLCYSSIAGKYVPEEYSGLRFEAV
jgi:hypothetical protein